MPVLDGYEATRRLRHELGDAGFIVGLTGNGLPADVERFTSVGADDVMIKPADVEATARRMGDGHGVGSCGSGCRRLTFALTTERGSCLGRPWGKRCAREPGCRNTVIAVTWCRARHRHQPRDVTCVASIRIECTRYIFRRTAENVHFAAFVGTPSNAG